MSRRTDQIQRDVVIAKSDFPSEWYEIVDDGHFWLEWRLHAFLNQVQDLQISTEVVLKGLDIGCGHGILQRQIEDLSAWSVDGVDLNEDALSLNTSGRGRTFLYDIHDRHPELAECYDFLILFDILEHIENTRLFLESALYHLKPNGWLFINVPALNIFFSDFDRIMGHIRRYDEKMIHAELDFENLQIKDIRYWGFSMLPFLIYRRLSTSPNASSREVIQKGVSLSRVWMCNWVLKVMKIETSILKKPFIGTSLMVAATKSEGG
jgi:SAM-dependent methyltransferase